MFKIFKTSSKYSRVKVEFEKEIEEAIIDLKLHHGEYEMSTILKPVKKSDWGYIIKIMTTKGLIVDKEEKFSNKHALTPYGWNFTTFQREFDKEDVDLKLKTISHSSIKFNKRLPFYAALIAIASASGPYIIYKWSKDDAKNKQLQVPQLETLLNKQEEIILNQKQILDSLTKKP